MDKYLNSNKKARNLNDNKKMPEEDNKKQAPENGDDRKVRCKSGCIKTGRIRTRHTPENKNKSFYSPKRIIQDPVPRQPETTLSPAIFRICVAKAASVICI